MVPFAEVPRCAAKAWTSGLATGLYDLVATCASTARAVRKDVCGHVAAPRFGLDQSRSAHDAVAHDGVVLRRFALEPRLLTAAGVSYSRTGPFTLSASGNLLNIVDGGNNNVVRYTVSCGNQIAIIKRGSGTDRGGDTLHFNPDSLPRPIAIGAGGSPDIAFASTKQAVDLTTIDGMNANNFTPGEAIHDDLGDERSADLVDRRCHRDRKPLDRIRVSRRRWCRGERRLANANTGDMPACTDGSRRGAGRRPTR